MHGSRGNVLYWFCAGLLLEHVPASAVDGSSPQVHAVQQQDDPVGEDAGRHVGEDLGARCLLPQREEGVISLHHYTQSTAESAQRRAIVVCHKVSILRDGVWV